MAKAKAKAKAKPKAKKRTPRKAKPRIEVSAEAERTTLWTYRCQDHGDWRVVTDTSRVFADREWDLHVTGVAAPHHLRRLSTTTEE
jgi:hypothetical protein